MTRVSSSSSCSGKLEICSPMSRESLSITGPSRSKMEGHAWVRGCLSAHLLQVLRRLQLLGSVCVWASACALNVEPICVRTLRASGLHCKATSHTAGLSTNVQIVSAVGRSRSNLSRRCCRLFDVSGRLWRKVLGGDGDLWSGDLNSMEGAHWWIVERTSRIGVAARSSEYLGIRYGAQRWRDILDFK